MSVRPPLVSLGRWLRDGGYRFVTGTPATHARVNARPGAGEARTLVDVFGWSRRFRPGIVPPTALDWLREAGALAHEGGWLRSRVRFSTLDDALYVHSAFPTAAADAVFFGPDTYRFADFIRHALVTFPVGPRARVVDIGCGSGAGGVVAMRALGGRATLTMTDINATALACAQVNAELAGVRATFRQCDLFAGLEPMDLVVANPPYIADPQARVYRDGGGAIGTGLSVRIAREASAALAPGGTLLLYTGAPVVAGQDTLRASIEHALQDAPVSWTYRELDPDVFGEELEHPAYVAVERIAAVGLVLKRRG